MLNCGGFPIFGKNTQISLPLIASCTSRTRGNRICQQQLTESGRVRRQVSGLAGSKSSPRFLSASVATNRAKNLRLRKTRKDTPGAPPIVLMWASIQKLFHLPMRLSAKNADG